MCFPNKKARRNTKASHPHPTNRSHDFNSYIHVFTNSQSKFAAWLFSSTVFTAMTSAAEFHEGALRQRRPSAQDAPSSPSLASSVKSLETRLENKFHISWDDLPAWRHDNAYIISGYHQARASYQHCARSIFHLHNESVNIWTHLLGAIFSLGAAAYLYSGVHSRYDYASPGDKLAFGCFFGGAVLCLGMSATFHALTHHSEVVMKWGNKLDYVGIVALIVGSNVPALYYGLFCEPDLMSVYLTIVSSHLPRRERRQLTTIGMCSRRRLRCRILG